MQRQVTLTSKSIDEPALVSQRRLSGNTGAMVSFVGVVRDTEAGAAISALEYEAFERMAEHQLQLLLDQMEKRWPIQSVRLVHRVGRVQVNEPSVWIEVTAAHRAEAFAACQWLIDELKKMVPIWKKPIPG